MRAKSFDAPPVNAKAIHQSIDQHISLKVGGVGQMGIAGGGQDAVVAEDFLDFQQVDTGFDQMGGIAVAQAVRGNLFFRPQSWAT
jgi:hypothetical protein